MKSKRRVLIIGLLDSVHLAKWLRQFCQEDIDFLLMPSKKFRKIHPLLAQLVTNQGKANYKILGSYGSIRLAGYVDYIRHEFFKKFSYKRITSIQRILSCNDFNFVHALEIQGAGYLLSDLDPNLLRETKVIVTNWGSDIYYFQNYPHHRDRIIKVLKLADFYSAECFRDYKLARQLGFMGVDLPCIPNSGGIAISLNIYESIKPSERKQIIVKGYGGSFGRIDLVLNALSRVLGDFPSIIVLIYSVTDDIRALVEDFCHRFPTRVSFRTVHQQLTIEEMRREMLSSRIYIGCSKSDGISTSFLEALSCGTFPIQTQTSCASEWVEKGFIADTVDLDVDELSNSILNALKDNDLVDNAQLTNASLSKEYLDIEIIKRKALDFYLT